ncbi:MAG: NADH-quinone oxidoreductase subunit C [Anaerolineae bacterium]|nr:NADH-quinone oxidoreductase subunit C [Anaerolineae bacterium]
MSDPALLAAVQTRFPDLEIAVGGFAQERVWTLSPSNLAQLGEFLRDETTPRYDLLLDINLIDDQLEYQLVSLSERQRLRLRLPCLPPPHSLAFVWPAANWLESQLFDLQGVSFQGHPQLGALFAPTDVPGAGAVWAGERLPTSVNGLCIDLDVDGGVVRRAAPRLGYRRCGLERRLSERPYARGSLLMARLDASAPFHADLAYALAVEALLGVEAPPRAQYARAIGAELARVASHLIWLSGLVQTVAGSIFAASVYAAQGAQSVRHLFQRLGGNPSLPDIVVPGGLRCDLAAGFERALRDLSVELEGLLLDLKRMLAANAAFLDGLGGIGVIDPGTALGLGLTGPCLRATGIAYDARRSFPYVGYEGLDFEVPVTNNGDAKARFRVRMAEMRASLDLIRQLEARLVETEGQPVDAFAPGKLPPTLPEGAIYAGVEAPRGELGVYLIANGTCHLAHAFVRGPSLANLSALPLMARDVPLEQVVTILDSLDVSVGEAER